MNEEIEYAEMLEIPVSTVNVVKKRGRKPKKSTALKEKVISKVNDAAALAPEKKEEPVAVEETAKTEEVVLPMQLPVEKEEPRSLLARYKAFSYSEESDERVPARSERLIFGIEVAAACALCLGIFLTNILLPTSAINTFFRSLSERGEEADARTYADFTLSAVAPKGTELTLSETGVLSFTEKCCVYPAANGEVASVTQNTDGSYTVTLVHSPAFTAVVSGLDYIPYGEGDSVKSNIPLGYSDGEGEVQVILYDEGEPLSCFSLSEEGVPVWNESVQE